MFLPTRWEEVSQQLAYSVPTARTKGMHCVLLLGLAAEAAELAVSSWLRTVNGLWKCRILRPMSHLSCKQLALLYELRYRHLSRHLSWLEITATISLLENLSLLCWGKQLSLETARRPSNTVVSLMRPSSQPYSVSFTWLSVIVALLQFVLACTDPMIFGPSLTVILHASVIICIARSTNARWIF